MKTNTMEIKRKKAQEEMVGFALIIILVAVILLIFLGFSLRDQEKETIESYEVESFIQSFLQYTSDCRDNLEFLSVQKLISKCSRNEMCLNGNSTCDVLNPLLKELVEESWIVGTETAIKGYELKINSFEEEILKFEEGNITANSKGSVQFLPNNIEIFFTAYF